MITIFDTETTGKLNFQLPNCHPSQPRIVQLGAILCEDDFTRRAHIDVIIKPDGWEIPGDVVEVHGITTAIAHRSGINLVTSLAMFAQFTSISGVLMGWNTDFDSRMLSLEFARCGLPHPPFSNKHQWRDVMKEATPICKLPPTRPGQTDYKWPKLEEAHRHFFKAEMTGAHSALNDCFATLKIAREIDKMNAPKQPNLL